MAEKKRARAQKYDFTPEEVALSVKTKPEPTLENPKAIVAHARLSQIREIGAASHLTENEILRDLLKEILKSPPEIGDEVFQFVGDKERWIHDDLVVHKENYLRLKAKYGEMAPELKAVLDMFRDDNIPNLEKFNEFLLLAKAFYVYYKRKEEIYKDGVESANNEAINRAYQFMADRKAEGVMDLDAEDKDILAHVDAAPVAVPIVNAGVIEID